MENWLRSSEEIKKILNQNMEHMKNEFSVSKIGIFGSYVRDSARPDSDIDIIVEFEEKSFDNYMDLKFFLEDLLGKKVDLVVSDSIKKRAKPTILKEAEYV